MPLIADHRFLQSAVVGPVRDDLFAPTAAPEEAPSALDTASAISRQTMFPGAAYEFLSTARDPKAAPAPPGYDPLNDIAGFEDEAHRFVGADSPAEVQSIKQRIGDARTDQDTLRRAGIGGTAATIAFNLLDPTFLAAAAVPELAVAKYFRISRAIIGAARGAAGAAGYEAAMHAVQDDRTLGTSAINIGAGALLGGVLGPILQRRIPADVNTALRDAVLRDLAPPRSEVGAASASAPATTLAQETIARGGRKLEALSGGVPLTRTDEQVVLHSSSVEARRVLQELADVSPILEKHVEGIPAPTAVELLVDKHSSRVADFVDQLNKAWVEYRARVPSGERMSEADFRAAVASSARNADEHAFPEVAESAKYLRSRVFDPLKVEAQQLKLLPEGVEATGYFMRMYDRNAIRRDRSTWNNLLVGHIMRGGNVDLAEARSIAEDVTRNILGLDVGQANFNVRSFMPNAGPLHERTLNIPDNLLEKFLVNDPVKVAGAYVRELAPQIEVTKRFGDKDMTSAFQRVKDEYDVLRARETDSKKITKLSDNETQSLEALARVRDRIYGRAGRLSPTAGQGARTAVAIARGWRNFVASARLGVAALVSVPQDTARIMAQHGFANTMGKVLKLASSPDFRALSKAQARRLSASIEVAMSRRVTVAYDGAATEGWTQALANGVYKWSGLNHWTDFGRTLSVTLLEDQVLKLAESGKPLTGWTKTSLAQLGIGDEELKGIAAEFAKHGGEVDGTRVSGSANWDDAALADRYDAALLKEARRLVKQPGAAHKVWWMDTETGKVVGQLKSFALSLPMSYAMPAAQMIGQGQAVRSARFVGYMMAGGAVAHVLRSYAAGKLPAQDPQTLAFEAFNEAGLAGVLPDLVSPLARRFGVVGESARYSDRNVLSTFGGPALGALGDAYDLAMNRTANGMSASDLHMLRRLLPYQNLWWLRRGINAVEGESAEQMGLKGAEGKDFGTRVIETTPLLPPNQRGGTGTGVVP